MSLSLACLGARFSPIGSGDCNGKSKYNTLFNDNLFLFLYLNQIKKNGNGLGEKNKLNVTKESFDFQYKLLNPI